MLQEASLLKNVDSETKTSKANETVLEAAAKLLESWKDLKEIYRWAGLLRVFACYV